MTDITPNYKSAAERTDKLCRSLIRNLDQAIQEVKDELRSLQGSAEPEEGLYDPWGIHQSLIDEMTALQKELEAHLITTGKEETEKLKNN